MSSLHDRHELLPSACVMLLGVFIATYSVVELDVGTLRAIGPGAFPTGLGVILTAIGTFMVGSAVRHRTNRKEAKDNTAKQYNKFYFLAVLASISAFALVIERFGLVFAVVLQVTILAAASRVLSWKKVLAFAVGCTLLAILTFPVGLSVPIAIARWPFGGAW